MRRVQMCPVPEGSGLKPIFGPAYPGIVDLIRFGVNPERFFRQEVGRWGDIRHINVFGRRMVMVMSPAGAEAVCLNKQKLFAAGPPWDFFIGRAFRRGLLLMDFDEHRYHRLIMQQAFTNTNLKGYLQEMQPMIAERMQQLPVGSVRLGHEFKALTLDMALEVFVGVKLPRDEKDRINRAFEACLNGLSTLVRYPIPGGRWARTIAGRKVLEEFFNQHLPAKRARQTPDLFSVLCHAQSEDGHVFSDEDVVNHMIFLLFAAHDTSTIALARMSYYMGRYPHWQQRAREQSLSLDAEIGYDTLGQMTELDMIMKEALRVAPPVPALIRMAAEDTAIDGYYIPKGTYLQVFPATVHQNPKVWSNPCIFDPERFSPDRHEDKIHKFAWMPFGGGVHKCIGLYFAQLEIKTIMHNLLRGYEWSVPQNYRWKTDMTTLGEPKDGLQTIVRRR